MGNDHDHLSFIESYLVLDAVHILFLFHTIPKQGRHHSPHFRDEEIKVQWGEEICWRSHIKKQSWDSKTRSVDSKAWPVSTIRRKSSITNSCYYIQTSFHFLMFYI